MPIRESLIAIAAMSIVLISGCDRSADPRSAAVDAVFAEFDSDATPGCAVGVVQDGAFVHKAGYGMANIEHGVPYRPTTPTRMASMSKERMTQ